MFRAEIFGQRLREARSKTGETLEQVGLLIGVKKSQMSEIEKGTASTTLEKVAILCAHFNISSDYLLGLTDEPAPRWGEKE